MSFTSAIAPELPFLRRYARTLTGSQQLGDSAVRETLEALLVAPEEFAETRSPRVELYRVFHKLWVGRLLGQIGDRENAHGGREALLLTAVEGFSREEASIVLGQAPEAIDASIAAARAEISRALRCRVLIIEDEAVIAMHIESIVAGAGHDVVGIAQTHRQAVDQAMTSSPELVLADISLADGSSGIDAVREILESISVPVIFVTAFPERLLTGERPEPTYLITKPFEPIMLEATMAQALMAASRAEALT